MVEECAYPEIISDLASIAKCGTHYKILRATVHSSCLYKKYEVTFVVKEACGNQSVYCIWWLKFYCGTKRIVEMKKEDKFGDYKGNIWNPNATIQTNIHSQ